ncbi:MAG TPA: hypothetical protein PKA28_10755 [Methylomusa anaerophila]|uniref:Phage transcriptional regulator, RinA family n=1 Tax=Methylomusa anaerophila TaxID=1930071 RepID=A0A348AIZ4_9FIRM|nr:hypothetical protein [Methylomusa anaerophila]BBB91042.1 hypothetical protein MAMMFC1_01710 [Methylomusa anaerophila]HML88914.1 hypothetical protein [Methylomusa anaerophila]
MDYIKEAEKRLWHYRDLEKSIEQMNCDIARIVSRSSPSELNAVAMDITGIRSGKTDEAFNILLELKTLSESKKKTEEEIDQIAEILKDISKEKDCKLYGKVLYSWYVKRKDRDEIAKEIGYSVRQVYNIRDEAIRKFAVRILGIEALRVI